MKSAVRRSMSLTVITRPSDSSPRSIILRAPAPIMLRADCSGIGGRPSRSSTKISAPIRSGAVSTSVPSRSKTMVGVFGMAHALPIPARSCKMDVLQSARNRRGEGESMREFKGKTAFVTGGASGIGLAMARAFAEAGMNVLLADVEQSALDQALKDLNQ